MQAIAKKSMTVNFVARRPGIPRDKTMLVRLQRPTTN
jgi:hypothetical protein